MGYILVDDFSGGLDRRKAASISPPGTLVKFQDGTVDVGGRITKRKKFNNPIDFSGDTTGIWSWNDRLVTFGTTVPGGGTPGLNAMISFGIDYVVLPPGGAQTITQVLDASPWGNQLYVIARFSDAVIRHFVVPYLAGHRNTGVATDVAVLNAKTGSRAKTHKTKTHLISGVNLEFSAVNTIGTFAGTGYGIIDVRTHDAIIGDLVGIEQYYGQLALFSKKAVQFWSIDPDPLLNTLLQTLQNTGLVAPHALGPYANGDVVYLSEHGIRSLRKRDSSIFATQDDIGTPIDSMIRVKRQSLTALDGELIRILVEPTTGDLWVIWGQDAYVLSHPTEKIKAWSHIRLPGPALGAAVAQSRLCIRVGDDLLVYGPELDNGVTPWWPAPLPYEYGSELYVEYDEVATQAVLPFMDLGKPAHVKKWRGLDVHCEGTWKVEVCPVVPRFEDTDPDGWEWTHVATVIGPTFGENRIGFEMDSTHLALRLTCETGDSKANVSAIALHSVEADQG